jgi:hypothetical protein
MVANIVKDEFNVLGLCNKRNTLIHNYNCGGWALNCFSWYRPTTDPCYCHWGDEYDEEPMTDSEMLRITDQAVRVMVREFADLRVIYNLRELKKDEYAIAFRIGHKVNDFHFCKRQKNGHWTHKLGGLWITPIKKEEVFSESWLDGYCGKIVLLAKKI